MRGRWRLKKLSLSRNPLKKSGCFPTHALLNVIKKEKEKVAIPSKNRGVFLPKEYLKKKVEENIVAIPSKNRGVFLLKRIYLPLPLKHVAIPSKNRGVFLLLIETEYVDSWTSRNPLKKSGCFPTLR